MGKRIMSFRIQEGLGLGTVLGVDTARLRCSHGRGKQGPQGEAKQEVVVQQKGHQLPAERGAQEYKCVYMRERMCI